MKPTLRNSETLPSNLMSSFKLYCWQSKDERGSFLPISRGQRLIVVHGGGCTGFVPGALLVWKATSSNGDYHSEMNGN
jgi:hypothetical protein